MDSPVHIATVRMEASSLEEGRDAVEGRKRAHTSSFNLSRNRQVRSLPTINLSIFMPVDDGPPASLKSAEIFSLLRRRATREIDRGSSARDRPSSDRVAMITPQPA